MDSELVIDSKYKNELEVLRNKMEAETGKLFQFTINQFNSEGSLKLGDFLERKNKIDVTIFPSYEKVEFKKGEIVRKDIDTIDSIRSLSGIYTNVEELKARIECVRRENNIFDVIEVSSILDTIYMHGGGKFAHCATIGKWKYLDNEVETKKIEEENKKVEVTIFSSYSERGYVVDANHEGKLKLLSINIDPIIQDISGTYEHFEDVVEKIDQIGKSNPTLSTVEIEKDDKHIYICESDGGFSNLIKIGKWKYV